MRYQLTNFHHPNNFCEKIFQQLFLWIPVLKFVFHRSMHDLWKLFVVWILSSRGSPHPLLVLYKPSCTENLWFSLRSRSNSKRLWCQKLNFPAIRTGKDLRASIYDATDGSGKSVKTTTAILNTHNSFSFYDCHLISSFFYIVFWCLERCAQLEMWSSL